MEDSDPLNVPLQSALSSDCHGFHDPLGASSSGVRTKIEDSLSDGMCLHAGITSADDSLLSKSYNGSQDSCMYIGSNLNREHGELEMIDDEEEDEGLYLAINSMPVKVEIEEENNYEEVKHEVDEMDYDRHQLDDASFLGEGGTSSASWYDTSYLVDEVNLEEVDSALPTLRKRKRGYYNDEDRRERERQARRRLMAKERARKYRNSLTTEQLEQLREKDRERTKRRRMMMSEDECLLVRLKNRENAQMRRMDAKGTRYKDKIEGLDSDEEKALIVREKNRERMRLKRLNMSEEEKIVERKKNRERVRKRRQIQKAEALLKKLINVHSDMVKQNSVEESNHFLQSLMDLNKTEIGTTINK